MNKVKCCCEQPLKNSKLARQLLPIISGLSEYFLPFYLKKREYNEVKNMHNLCYLLANKMQESMCSPVIRSCMDSFWDLKGLNEVLSRILKIVGMSRKYIDQC